MERIQLHKLGYTKEEINQLAADNYKPEGLVTPPEEIQDPVIEEIETPKPEPAPDNSAVLAAINNLTAALQANAIKTSAQPEMPKESAEDALFNILK